MQHLTQIIGTLTSILNAKPTKGAAKERVGSSLIVFFSFLNNVIRLICDKAISIFTLIHQEQDFRLRLDLEDID